MTNATRLAGVALVVSVVLGACGSAGTPGGQRSASARPASLSPVDRLDHLGAFVVQCGPDRGPQELGVVQDGLHRLTRSPYGVSEMSVNASGTVVYAATETIGADVHVLRNTDQTPTILGPGPVVAVAPDGRIALVRTDQRRRPLRDDVYIREGGRTRKVATFPLVWQLFWRHGKVAAMIGPGRTHLVWDVKHPNNRLTLPSRGGRTIQLFPQRDLVAAQLPKAGDRFDLAVASRSAPHFRRVARNLYPLAWSPTGRYILASDFRPSQALRVVDVRRHTTSRIGTLPCGRVFDAAWLPRGTKLPPAPAG
jgi:hypothetical protein